MESVFTQGSTEGDADPKIRFSNLREAGQADKSFCEEIKQMNYVVEFSVSYLEPARKNYAEQEPKRKMNGA